MKLLLTKLLATIATAISPKLYIKLSYLHNRGRFPNLKNPKDISEIILSTMYSGKVNEYSDYVDKIKVRDFYTQLGYGEFLPKLYGIWETTDEIDFDKFPSSFALKTNHGCGHHYICKDKRELDIKEAEKTIDFALNTKFGLAETQYHSIQPKVYCEEYIDEGTEELLPSDFKFMCVDGEIKSILIVTERTEKSYKLITYDTEWERLDYIVPSYKTKNEFPKPLNLDLMIEISKKV